MYCISSTCLRKKRPRESKSRKCVELLLVYMGERGLHRTGHRAFCCHEAQHPDRPAQQTGGRLLPLLAGITLGPLHPLPPHLSQPHAQAGGGSAQRIFPLAASLPQGIAGIWKLPFLPAETPAFPNLLMVKSSENTF